MNTSEAFRPSSPQWGCMVAPTAEIMGETMADIYEIEQITKAESDRRASVLEQLDAGKLSPNRIGAELRQLLTMKRERLCRIEAVYSAEMVEDCVTIADLSACVPLFNHDVHSAAINGQLATLEAVLDYQDMIEEAREM